MSFEPSMWATFCDDVRQELGNKLSYMGVYGPNLIVPSFPTTLPKLCCLLNLRLAADSLPQNVRLMLFKEEEVVFETELARQEIAEVPGSDGSASSEERALTFTAVAQFVNFAVTDRCLLKARAIVDGKTLRGGALELLAADAVAGSRVS